MEENCTHWRIQTPQLGATLPSLSLRYLPLPFPTSGLPACTQPPTFSRRRHMPVAYWKDNFRVLVSLGSAETLVRRDGIINHHWIAYSLSNISVKNYRNRLMWVESIVCNISVVLGTQCTARGPGERRKLPQRGLGRSPSGNRIWCILALKSDICWHQFY